VTSFERKICVGEKKGSNVVYPMGWQEELIKERISGQRAEAKERRLARPFAGPTLRARAARKLFEFAVALEREEAWRAVWEKLEAPRRL
jgi:hypothetical protein